MKRNILTDNKAFSLLEITVVIIILTILASAAVPVLSRAYVEKAGNKTALDISAIQEAARAYYIDNNRWPDSSLYPTPIATLQAGNYLPSSWNAINPFGVNTSTPLTFSYNAKSTGSTFTVYTDVPIAAEAIIQNLLPTSWTSENIIYSSVPVPGASSVLPTGVIIPWASINLPAGFLWCNGQVANVASYQNLYNVIGSTYDVPGDGADGVNTFAVPDMMGRVIVGVDSMGGASAANRINQWGNIPATMGGTFGEDVHALTISEMPPHDFQTLASNSPHGGGWLDFQGNGSFHGFSGGGTGQGLVEYRTGFRGGNNDGSANSTVVPHNVVQPSVALGYIIKY